MATHKALTWATKVYDTPQEHPSLYMLTDSMWESPDDLKWGPSVSHIPSDVAIRYSPTNWMSLSDFCTSYQNLKEEANADKYIRVYTHPILAILMNRVDGGTQSFSTLWEGTGSVKFTTCDYFAYCTEMKTVRIAKMPVISPYTRMKFGFGCVDKVYKDPVFLDWILDWVGNKNRSKERAEGMAEYCSRKAQEEQDRESVDYDNLKKLFAAHWMCLAAVAYIDPEEKDTLGLVEYWTGQAAVEAAQAAHALKIPDFDLVRIAELTMAAR